MSNAPFRSPVADNNFFTRPWQKWFSDIDALVNGPGSAPRKVVANVNYSALASDQIIAYTSLTASRTVTFTPRGTPTNVKLWCVKDEAGNAGTFAIVIASTSGTFDGLATTSINTNSGSKTFYDNGTNFFMY